MRQIAISKTIDAPVDVVFNTIANIEEFSKAVPHIVNIEFVSDSKTGVGARFKETRIMNGKEASTELELTEYVQNEKVRFVSDAGGTIWDTLFTVTPTGDGTEATMVMDVKPHTLLAKLTTPLITGMVSKAVEKDMDAIKTYCESQTA